ncbi:hypothetical protein L484_005865 [Morus notabilis]|uniref:Uncharacterized protein n=1 Tax=Morus notabilis TaxID=981085 RepID=W9SHQ5_9ROSA|nr:hypothetical protein L484_005865 [Morus notabilis]
MQVTEELFSNPIHQASLWKTYLVFVEFIEKKTTHVFCRENMAGPPYKTVGDGSQKKLGVASEAGVNMTNEEILWM